MLSWQHILKKCLKLQEMLSLESIFQNFTIHQKCQTTKSQAFETKYYGHPGKTYRSLAIFHVN